MDDLGEGRDPSGARRGAPGGAAGQGALESLPTAGPVELRVWLRLFACTNLVEAELRRRLRGQFNTTLPRFDLMAQLARVPDGIPLGELSRRMMVSNGNVTGLVERLAAEGLVERRVQSSDRRYAHVRLTRTGSAQFAEMAAAHRSWIAELLGGIAPAELQRLLEGLDALKASLAASRPDSAS